VEALKKGASRTLASCVTGTQKNYSWLSVVIFESYTYSSDGSTAGSSVASWGPFGVGSLMFIPALTNCTHETSVDLHNTHCMCSSKIYYHINEYRYFAKPLTMMQENFLEILSLSLFFSSPEKLKSSPILSSWRFKTLAVRTTLSNLTTDRVDKKSVT
jgi:hypothetical protein